MSRIDNLRSIAAYAAEVSGLPAAKFEAMLGVGRPVVRCTHCLTGNRIDPARVNPRCGCCGFPLERP